MNRAKSKVQRLAEAMICHYGFMGVPVASFEQGGRNQFAALLQEGLCPESKVLDIGCGCLRTGYWLIRFLDSGGYCGIEPARQRVARGIDHLFAQDEIALKQPRFDFNPDFDSSVFGTRFDFFLAGSIWTHASKRQIDAMLDSFVRDSVPGAVFLASYLPARFEGEDYQHDRWCGTSHESNTPGVIRHSLTWIAGRCRARGLELNELPGGAFDGVFWLRVSREPSP